MVAMTRCFRPFGVEDDAESEYHQGYSCDEGAGEGDGEDEKGHRRGCVRWMSVSPWDDWSEGAASYHPSEGVTHVAEKCPCSRDSGDNSVV